MSAGNTKGWPALVVFKCYECRNPCMLTILTKNDFAVEMRMFTMMKYHLIRTPCGTNISLFAYEHQAWCHCSVYGLGSCQVNKAVCVVVKLSWLCELVNFSHPRINLLEMEDTLTFTMQSREDGNININHADARRMVQFLEQWAYDSLFAYVHEAWCHCSACLWYE